MSIKTQIKYVTLGEIKPYERNPRKNGEAVTAVAESIRQYGFKQPLVIDENGVIIVGHTRYEAAKKLGLESVPCIVATDLSPEKAREYRLVDNRTNEMSSWDFDKLKLELEDLDFGGFDFCWPGVDEEEEDDRRITSQLSEIAFKSIYYEPKAVKNLTLLGCVDNSLYDKKMAAIEESDLSEGGKAVMRIFAERFRRIDFEGVANYYAFVATPSEQKVMRRLRLVLADDGCIEGFLEDDLIRTYRQGELLPEEIEDLDGIE